MLRHVSSGQYLEAIRMAEKFILHVEVLFATIDDLEWQFAQLSMKGTLRSAPDAIFFFHLSFQACHMLGKHECSAERR